MRKIAFYMGYGLLPLWAAIAIVWVGSLHSQSHEYWNVAPWLIVFSIPACAVTMAVATVTLVVHARLPGDPPRRNKIAAGAFVAMNLLLVAIAGAWWLHSTRVASDVEVEKARALDFVRSHPTVVERFGTDIGVDIVSYRTGSDDPFPKGYEVSIDTKRPQGTDPGSQHVYAIVTVKESAGQRQLVLDCLTPTYMGQRDPFKDPCTQ